MTMEQIELWIASCLVLGLRIAPLFIFAPPFSLTRIPRSFHLLFGLGLSVALVSADPARRLVSLDPHHLLPAAAGELLLGIAFVLMLQLCFAALYLAGRHIDIQAGFGLATLIDPNSQTQTPLVGTMFALAAGALFFSMDGHIELLRIISLSLDAVPLGQWQLPGSLDRLMAFISAIFVLGMGVGGGAVLLLFLIDLIIALLARTVPQMNVLLLGFQVKTIALLIALPLCFGAGGALMVRMIRLSLDAMVGLFRNG
jgi:flagellar biosynthesis protein FliR